MKKKYNISEALNFLIDNDLCEIYFDKPQNHFLINDLKNKSEKNTASKNQLTPNYPEDGAKKISRNINAESINQPKKDNDKIINPVFSTTNAIANLAKKNQILNNDPMVTNNSSDKFMPIDEIIATTKNIANNCRDLDELKKAILEFESCNLKKIATNTVFCDGNPKSKIMVIGEAPGNHEDLQGIPFCGDSGSMLNEMLQGINLDRKNDFYVTNVIFWRPPGNRRPTNEELAICRPFVERHITLFSPKIIILVGATAMEAILGIKDPITKIRGQILDYNADFLTSPCKIFTIFHPSFLMRQPMKKKVAWQDMLTLEKYIKNNF